MYKFLDMFEYIYVGNWNNETNTTIQYPIAKMDID
jgi:hypothetical protein